VEGKLIYRPFHCGAITVGWTGDEGPYHLLLTPTEIRQHSYNVSPKISWSAARGARVSRMERDHLEIERGVMKQVRSGRVDRAYMIKVDSLRSN